ncbi:MAG TPA: ABC transporter permease [Candidatus Angelobacter sp.]|nr:ABC transporter permease [Candidatus Angelobacter sp.]
MMKGRKRILDDLDDDIRDHIERETQDNIERGIAPEEARTMALRKFGNVVRVKEEARKVWSLVWLEQLLQDVRFGLRMLRRNPGFTAVAAVTLALGIGANTAIFSVVYAVLLKPLPYTNPQQLFTAFQANQQQGIAEIGCSYLNFEDWRAQNHVFSELGGVVAHQLTLTGRGEPTVVNVSVVTPELFALLDAKPLAGRIFFPADGKQSAPPVAILSEDLWRRRFGGDPKITGSPIELDKRLYTIIAVMPADFRTPFFNKQEVWVPLVQDPVFSTFMPRRGVHLLPVIGRLKPGVSVAQAKAEMDAISERLAREFPAENKGWSVRLVPLQKEITGDVRAPLLVLLSAVGLVLLIACANIANLLLARATSRSKEIAVRTALGAGRARIMRQLLSESVVLGLLGGGVGIALAFWGVHALGSLVPRSLLRVNAIGVDNQVLGFAVLLSSIAGIVFGLVPAVFAVNPDVQNSLREGGGRSGESRNRRRARSFLAAAEISLAMVLLVTAGLLLRSFANLISVSPGFEPQNIVQADISLPQSKYSTPQQWAAFSEEVLARIQSEPGLQDTAVAVPRPIVDNSVNLTFEIAGSPPSSSAASRRADYESVSPDYFRVMRIPLLAGRLFTPHDAASEPRVSIISKTMARLYFPNENPIGKHISFAFSRAEDESAHEIVGIVDDVRDVALGQNPGAMMYVPYAQAPLWGANLVIRTTLSTASVGSAIRREVENIDKDVPVTDIAKMPNLINASIAQSRFRTFLLGLVAAMALVLAATGIFGVISYSVSRRTNEIGIRIALGASRKTILSLILRETLGLTLAGLAVGFPCALVASHFARHLLFNVSSNDPTTLAAVALCLAAVAGLAGYIPARRAMRVDPLVALRCE